MNSPHILIIEDERDIVDLMRYNLEKEGFTTDAAMNGKSAISKLEDESYDMVLLDLMLPEINGMEICRHIKENKKLARTPIIIVSARDDEIDRILGLEMGADDYLNKPFSPRELIARIKAVLRRTARDTLETDPADVMEVSDLLIDAARLTVQRGGKKIDLTVKEFQLLLQFARNPGVIFSREYLLDTVWGNKFHIEDRTVDVHIRRLREKLEDEPSAPAFIMTKRGVGYYFADSSH